MQTRTMKQQWLAVVGAASLLTACGGGSGSSYVATPPAGPTVVAGTDVPVAVEQSTAGVISFAKTQLAATSESGDPLVVGDAKLATDETAEPSDV